MAEQLLTGWGRTAPSRATVTDLAPAGDSDLVAEVADALADAGTRGIICRGLGRSYNDAAQNGGGTVLRLPDGPWRVDQEQGLLHVPAGARLHDVISDLVPRGWFVPVTPGTRMVTVGGMVAADVHGKNHHRDGSLGAHLHSIEIVTPADGAVTLTPEGPAAERFWATVGGMGLTGVITAVTMALIPVHSSQILADEQRHPDLDSVMAALAASEDSRYSVAWVDGTSRGRRLGRGLVSVGDHADAGPARRDQNADAGRARRGQPRAARSLPVPLTPPINPLNRWSITAFNEVWYRKPGTGERLVPLESYFHPLDLVADWNRLYGPRGFVQYQFVVPDAAADLVRHSLEALQRIGAASFLAVLKRFGPGNPGPLSFPAPGWTLALDLPAGVTGLARVLDDLDDRVAGAGGRLYLAKDGRMRPALLSAMYPRLARWQAVRDSMDPEHVMSSDLARRMGL